MGKCVCRVYQGKVFGINHDKRLQMGKREEIVRKIEARSYAF